MNNLIENPLLSLKAKYWNTNQISKEKSKLLFPISNIFYTDKFEGEIVPQESEVEEIRWCDFQDILDLDKMKNKLQK
jgi:hypothetical protein